MKAYSEADVPSQAGRVHLVTGANTGIGFEAALVLARCGARVLLGCRSEERGQAACERILSQLPEADLKLILLDLGDLGSVREAADEVLQEGRLDCLINNAGLVSRKRNVTKDGFEAHFGVNHLGPFALTGHLLARLEEAEHARVVNVSSSGHRIAVMDWKDLQAEHSYQMFARYAMSKLANLHFTFELERRLRARHCRAISLACHPGGALTDLARDIPKRMQQFFFPFLMPFVNTSRQGALPTLRAATDPQARGGDYYGPRGPFEVAGPPILRQPEERAMNRSDAERLWDVSVELTGVDPFAHL